jgi:hypothetical protein
LPRTEDAAEQKRIIVIEQQPGIQPVMTEKSSIKQAVALIEEIRKQAPLTNIIVDTASSTGREIVRRTKEIMKFNERGYDPHYWLTQLFGILKESMPTQANSQQKTQNWVQDVVKRIYSPRKNGGRRPCTESDILNAHLAAMEEPPSPTDPMFDEILRHPIGFVPQFFFDTYKHEGINVTSGGVTAYDHPRAYNQQPFSCGFYRLFPQCRRLLRGNYQGGDSKHRQGAI